MLTGPSGCLVLKQPFHLLPVEQHLEIDREQRDWGRRIVKKICAPAVASTMAARKDIQELEVFVTAFRRNILPGTSEEIRSRSYELARRTLDQSVQMDHDITGVAMAIDVPTGSVLLDAFNRLARGSVPGNLPQMLDGRHDPQLESLSKELQGKISRLSILGRLIGNLVRNPPLNDSPREAAAFEDDVRKFLVLIESDSERETDRPAHNVGGEQAASS